MRGAPEQRERHERELDEQHLPVALVPEVGEVRQPDHAQVDARREQHDDQHRRELGEADEGVAAQLRRERPDDEREHERARPPRSRPLRDAPSRRTPSSRDEPASTAEWPESESPEAKPSESRNAAQSSQRPLGQPGEVQERGHEREPERHRDERGAEARPAGERREIAVEEVHERELQRVLGPEQEREDPDLDRADRADAHDPVEAPLGPRRHRAAHDEQAEPEPADQQREREEVEPADDVLLVRRPGCAERLGRRRGALAHAEREDPGDDVAVGRDHAPADGVRAAREVLRPARSRSAGRCRASTCRRRCAPSPCRP